MRLHFQFLPRSGLRGTLTNAQQCLQLWICLFFFMAAPWRLIKETQQQEARDATFKYVLTVHTHTATAPLWPC